MKNKIRFFICLKILKSSVGNTRNVILSEFKGVRKDSVTVKGKPVAILIYNSI